MTALLALCGLAVGVIIGQVLHDRRHPVVKATGYNPPPPMSEPRPDPPPAPPEAPTAVKAEAVQPEPIRHSVSGQNGHRGKNRGKKGRR